MTHTFSASRDTHFEPSRLQSALLLAESLGNPDDVFNLSEGLHLIGRFDVNAAKAALSEVVTYHGMLRARFINDGDQWTACIQDEAIPRFVSRDLSGHDPTTRQAEARKVATRFAQERFDVSLAPLVRFLVIRLAENEHILLLVAHHLVVDGWSLHVILRQFEALYSGTENTSSQDNSSYAEWAKQANARFDQDCRYWRNSTQGSLESINLPADWSRNDVRFEPKSISRPLDKDSWMAVSKIATSSSVTRNTVLIGALAELLRNWTGQSCGFRRSRPGVPI
ncbi:NRPS condensation-like uncharacterized protein [Bradyrhizobium sp. USDA 4369]